MTGKLAIGTRVVHAGTRDLPFRYQIRGVVVEPQCSPSELDRQSVEVSGRLYSLEAVNWVEWAPGGINVYNVYPIDSDSIVPVPIVDVVAELDGEQ